MLSPYFFLQKLANFFLSHRPQKLIPFSYSSSSPPPFPRLPPRCDPISPVPSLKFSHRHSLLSSGCHPLDGVTRGGPPTPPPPSVTPSPKRTELGLFFFSAHLSTVNDAIGGGGHSGRHLVQNLF